MYGERSGGGTDIKTGGKTKRKRERERERGGGRMAEKARARELRGVLKPNAASPLNSGRDPATLLDRVAFFFFFFGRHSSPYSFSPHLPAHPALRLFTLVSSWFLPMLEG
jgi:hypothetical protein